MSIVMIQTQYLPLLKHPFYSSSYGKAADSYSRILVGPEPSKVQLQVALTDAQKLVLIESREPVY